MNKGRISNGQDKWAFGFGLLRGGRVTKVAGRDGSYAPYLGGTVESCGSIIPAFAHAAAKMARKGLLALLLASGSSVAYAQDECIVGTNSSDWDCVDGNPDSSAATNAISLDGTGDSDNATVDLLSGFTLDSVSAGEGGITVTDDQAITITQNAGSSIKSYQAALSTKSYGGDIKVYGSGEIESTTSVGVYARQFGGSNAILIDTSGGTVQGHTNGIVSQNTVGDLKIYTANVTGTIIYGIDALIGHDNPVGPDAGGGDLTIDSTAGIVTGGIRGISALVHTNSSYAGNTTIIKAGETTGTSGDGIHLETFEYTGNSTISAYGDITGSTNGIYLYSTGQGTIDIALGLDANGDPVTVKGNTAMGIRVDASQVDDFGNLFSRTVTVRGDDGAAGQTGAVTGGTNGINVAATDDITIKNLASVTGDSDQNGSGDGIAILDFGADVAISNIGSVSGANGIRVSDAQGKLVSIQNIGSVTGTTQAGIDAYSGLGNIDIGGTSALGNVTGGTYGIRAISSQGSLTIDTSGGRLSGVTGGLVANLGAYSAGGADITVGEVYTQTGPGISVFSSGPGPIDIIAASVESDFLDSTSTGINVRNFAAAEISITGSGSAADITAYAGIRADGVSSIEISNFETIDARGDGVWARATELTIDVGTVNSEAARGIYAHGTVFGGNMSITTAGITAQDRGIDATLHAGGALTIDTRAGAVTSTTKQAIRANVFGHSAEPGVDETNIYLGEVTSMAQVGVRLLQQANSGNATIRVDGKTAGHTQGLFVTHDGVGSTEIILGTDGEVSSTTNSAIEVGGTSGATQAVKIRGDDGTGGPAGTVTGGTNGIKIAANGDITISNLASVTGDSDQNGTGDGIAILDFGADVAISNIGSISGAHGIQVADLFGYLVSIQNIGSVTGTTKAGIRAYSGLGNIDIGGTSRLGNVTGGTYGIQAETHGDGQITIDTSGGTVTASGAPGIDTTSQYGDQAITTANVTAGANTGVRAKIGVPNAPGGVAVGAGDLLIDTTAGTVTAQLRGIDANVYGRSSTPANTTTIKTGKVVGTSYTGIELAAHAYTGAIAIAAYGNVEGGTSGIDVTNSGQGNLDILLGRNGNGDPVTVSGQAGPGIEVDASGAAATSTVTVRGDDGAAGQTGAVTGGTNGINVAATGDITIKNLASVTGDSDQNGSGDGIAILDFGADVAISNIGSVSGANGIRVSDAQGKLVSIQNIGSVTGTTQAGIDAYSGLGNIDIGGTSALGNVTGGTFGIQATSSQGSLTIDTSGGRLSGVTGGLVANLGHLSTGGADITVGEVYTQTGSGISLVQRGTGGNVDIIAASVRTDLTTSHSTGIHVDSTSPGEVSITGSGSAATVTGYKGIDATSNGSMEISNFETIHARGYGLAAFAFGDLTIDVGTVTSDESKGILAEVFNAPGDLSITTDNVTAWDRGIDAIISGGRTLTIDTRAGEVKSTTKQAIRARVFGDFNAPGVDETNIYLGEVTSLAQVGVRLLQQTDSGNATIHVDGKTAGYWQGMYVTNQGLGSTEIIFGADGEVSSTTISAIEVSSTSGATHDVKIRGDDGTGGPAGTVTGGTNGIAIATNGDITISNLASVTGDSDQNGTGDGLDLSSSGGAVSVVNIGSVSGSTTGIKATAQNGNISVGSIGSINSDGIGIRAVTYSGSITIGGIGEIDSSGDGIWVDLDDTAFSGTTILSLDSSGGAIVSQYGDGISVLAEDARGDLSITTASVTGAGHGINIVGSTSNGRISIDTSAGAVHGDLGGISVTGVDPINAVTGNVTSYDNAIYLSGFASISLDTTRGEVSGTGYGILGAVANVGAGAPTATLGITSGKVSGGRVGIAAMAAQDVNIDVNSVAGAVEGARTGIYVFGGYLSGSINIETADVTATGDRAATPLYQSNYYSGVLVLGPGIAGDVTIDSTAGTVSGDRYGILVDTPDATGALDISVAGVTARSGDGIALRSDTGPVTLTVAGTVSGADNAVDIATSGDITVTIAETGLLTSRSGDTLVFGGSGNVTIQNYGTIVGSTLFGAGSDTLTNMSSNSVDLRAFDDSDLDNTRDRESVAVNDFGAGNDILDNAAGGVVRILTVADESGFSASTDDDTSPTSWDTTGEYVPNPAENAGGTANPSITAAGVEQAHIINLETFVNAGAIVLQDALTGGTQAIAGDVLVITGAATAGTDGGGMFISDGGELWLDVLLNDGIGDIADMLVVDGTSVGTGGATSIHVVHDLLGIGSGTDLNNNGIWDEGEGILLVEVLNAGASDAGAFELSSIVYRNGLAYDLFWGATGGDWYLANLDDAQNTTFCGSSQTISTGVIIAALGCAFDESFAIEGDASADKVEGAGGSDTIVVRGNADVVTGVFGGGDGQDSSAAQDTGDTITIDTTGVVGLVDSQLGDDTITIANGDVGTVYGNVGNDTIRVSGGVVQLVSGDGGNDSITATGGTIGIIDGGVGNDMIDLTDTNVTNRIAGGSGNDSILVTNGGIGSIFGGDGYDSVTLVDSAVSGIIDMGEGIARVSLTRGSAGTIATGSDSDSIWIDGTAIGGMIVTGDGDDAIELRNGSAALLIAGAGDDSVMVEGALIHQAIATGEGDDTIALVSSSAQRVLGEGGDDTITLDDSIVSLDIQGGEGLDTIAMSGGSAREIDTGADADMLSIDGSAISGAISTGDGSDTIAVNAATVGSLATGEGDDSVALTGTTIAGVIVSGDGPDTVTNPGNLDTGSGNDTVTMDGATIAGNVLTWDGDDSVTLVDSDVDGVIDTGNGVDDVSLTHGSIDRLDTGAGNDTVTVDGTAISGALTTGEGDDSVTLVDSDVDGVIDTGNGVDDVSLTHGSIDRLDTGAGNDTVTMDGTTISGALATGEGDDSITLIAGSAASVAAGAGSDILIVRSGFDLAATTLDGGDDASTGDGMIDSLTFDGVQGVFPRTGIANFEIVNLIGGAALALDGEFVIEDQPGTGLFIQNESTLSTSTGFDFTGNLSIDRTSGLVITGSSPVMLGISGDFMLSGLADLRNGIAGDVLTVGGDFSGEGALGLDVDFATASGDTLLVTGDIFGTTSIEINALGVNEATFDSIVLVTAEGSINADNFVLDGGPVLAGLYAFDLELQGQSVVLANSVIPTSGMFEALPLTLLGFVEPNSMRDRVGHWLALDDDGHPILKRGAWGTFQLDRRDTSPAGSIFGVEIDSERERWNIGLTLVPVEDLAVSGWFRHTRIESDIANELTPGAIDAEAVGAGIAVTYLGSSGLYAEVQATRDWIDFAASATGTGAIAHDGGAMATGASLEVGHRFGLDRGFSLTPQVQLGWQAIDIDRFTGPIGEIYEDGGDNDMTTLRVGLQADGGPGEREDGFSAFATIDATHSFDPRVSGNVNGFNLATYGAEWVGEVGMGARYRWGDGRYGVFVEGELAADLAGDAKYDRTAVNAGLRVRF